MIVIAIGANLAAAGLPSPLATCEAAVDRLGAEPRIEVLARSRWYESEPVPASDQPWYVNGAVLVRSDLRPAELLACLHAIEASFGRVRRTRNEARPLDLDLIEYEGEISPGRDAEPILPHPRASERAFVLLPIADIAPTWRHPASGMTVRALIDALPKGGPLIRPVAPLKP